MESRLARIERMIEEDPIHILDITRDHSHALQYIRSHNLLKNSQTCSNCADQMKLITNNKKC